MTQATLLTVPDHPAGRNLFAFDHAMAHRNIQVVMGPLSQWSKAPYYVDPFVAERPADQWHQNHQQAHDDFNRALPAYGKALVEGIPTAKNLVDTDLNDQGKRQWWIFSNHQEHYISSNAIFPLPFTPTGTPPKLIWWMRDPRLVAVYW